MRSYLISWSPPTTWRRWLLFTIGIVIAVGSWEFIGSAELLGTRMPSISSILIGFLDPRISAVIARSIAVTVPQAGIAFVFGVLAGVLGALLQLLVPATRRSAHRFASLLNAVPAIILSPILVSIFGVQQVPVVVGTLGVFFSVFVTTSSGFLNVPAGALDYVRTLGSSPWARFRHVEGPAALPYFADGLRLAGPSAILGTMFGEWFGSSNGLGVLVQVAWQNFQVDLLWAAALTATALAISAIAIFGFISKLLGRRFS